MAPRAPRSPSPDSDPRLEALANGIIPRDIPEGFLARLEASVATLKHRPVEDEDGDDRPIVDAQPARRAPTAARRKPVEPRQPVSSLAAEVAVSIDTTASRDTTSIRTIGPLPRCYPSTNIMLSHFLVTSLMHAQRHNNRSVGWFARV